MCTAFVCNRLANLCYLLHSSHFVILGIKHLDTGYLVNTTAPTVLFELFLNFASVFVKI